MTQAIFSAILREEKEARTLTGRLVEIAARGDAAEIAATLGRLKRTLHADLETHFATEEAHVFPMLSERGMNIEVGIALEQHADLRRRRQALEALAGEDAGALCAWLRAFANALDQHVRFEADCLFVDLRRGEAAALREELDSALSSPPPDAHRRPARRS